MKNRNPYKKNFCQKYLGPAAVAASSLLLVGSIFMFFVGIPALIESEIKAGARLVNGTVAWGKWSNVTVPILTKFFLFNVTNPDRVFHGAKFVVQEVGPYVFEQKRVKKIIAIDEEEDTVTYKDTIHYHFRPDLSHGSLDDEINIVNLPFITVSKFLHDRLYSFMADSAIEYFVNENESLVIPNVKVRNITFDGVRLNPMYTTLSALGDVELPPQFRDGTFALYNGKNGSLDEPIFKVSRGVKSTQDFGQIVTYNGAKELSFWTNKSLPRGSPQYCNKINGTDGTLFSPSVTKDRTIYIFAPDACRSLYFTFKEETEYFGVPAYKFQIPTKLLANPDLNEDNRCFCVKPEEEYAASQCFRGALRLFPCTGGAPIVLSRPHMFEAGDDLLNSVEGLRPDASKHGTELIIEPNAGIILKIIKRLQISVELQPLPGITAFENITRLSYVPAVWLEERAELDEVEAGEIRNLIVLPMKILSIAQWVIPGILLAILLLSVYLTFLPKKKVTDTYALKAPPQDT